MFGLTKYPIFILLCAGLAHAWGPEGHAIINRQAAALMPAPLDSAFAFWADSLAGLGAVPDEWRKTDESQKNRHFIDLDMLAPYPFSGFPVNQFAAEKKFGKKALKKAGILPWAIESDYTNLKKDFGKGTWEALRNDLIGLAHFVGDGHQPYHLTENYNGKLTGNPGVHFRFEIDLVHDWIQGGGKLPLRFLKSPERKIDHLNQHTFGWMRETYALLDSANASDIECGKGDGASYKSCYQGKTAPMAAQQMANASSEVAAYWYSAWLEAGKPKLKWK